ncbi:MAG: NAD(P)H-dependent oxidoreductase [Nanoarchaeota archaeon]
MSKKVLIIFAHPKKDSLNGELLKQYKIFLEEQKIKYEIINLYGEGFDPVLRFTKPNSQKDLIKEYQNLILWADHLTFIYPVWWSGMPAIMKGFIDRVFEAGFAFQYRKGKNVPKKFLTGKTATLIRTYGGPKLGSILIGKANYLGLRFGVFWFTGIKLKNIFDLYKASKSSFSKEKLDKFLKKIKKSIKNLY